MQKTSLTHLWFVGCLVAGVCFWLVGLQACSTPKEEPKITETKGVKVLFNTDGKWKTAETFYHFPFPSDLRLNKSGSPDMTGYPNPTDNSLVQNLLEIVKVRPKYPVIPVAYFQFPEALPKIELQKVIPGSKDASILLMDIDDKSKNYGKLYPVAATLLESGDYVPKHLLAASAYPGVILEPERKYAFVVMRSLKDAKGEPLGVPKALNQLKAGVAPEGTAGKELLALYKPLWTALKKQGIKVEDVAAATVFTTGDVVAEMSKISDALLSKNKLEITGIELDKKDGDHKRYCELWGKIKQPQYQEGIPPFDKKGLFTFDANGIPKKLREKELPVVITLPKKPMPTGGYPLMVYVHGSGGYTNEVVDRGPQNEKGGEKPRGLGPSHVVAAFGVATTSTAMPVNPERLKGASDIAYLNLKNLKAFRDVFRQGVIESRLFLDALLRVKIDPKALGTCTGPTLPKGETHFRFSDKRLVLMGQSMGAMYTNMISAVEPRYKAIIPTGAGGYWSYFALHSNVPILKEPLLRSVLSSTEKLTYTHPVMQLLQAAWEPSEPIVYVPRIARRPLPKHPIRHIYQPVGMSDSYFPETIMDMFALAYGNSQAGKEVWPGTQKRLAIQKRGGLAPYPVKSNRKSGDTPFTGVTVQFAPDEATKDGHMIAFQLDAVKFQFSCFLSTFIKTGKPVVPEPKSLGTPCPE